MFNMFHQFFACCLFRPDLLSCRAMPQPLLVPIGGSNSFYNLRGSFKPFFFLELGTQMSFIKLRTGKFLVLSTSELNEAAKIEINSLTNGGTLIEAVIATHPFHTLHFQAFYKLYPNVPYYGTPRHLRIMDNIKWAGSVTDESFRKRWEGEGVYMSYPDGVEFDNAKSHFTSLLVFHAPTKTVHVDDTLVCHDEPGFILNMLLGATPKSVTFHSYDKLDKVLLPTPSAPRDLKQWIQAKLVDEWDYDNIAAAHTGNIIGGAKNLLKETFASYSEVLDKIAEERLK